MAPPSQDLDARFAVFMNPIRDLTKNWEVDIAKYLEDYLSELAEVQITLDDGHTVMNFAEAAMLIQGSATVYGKKVEFLWQMVLQMIDLLSSRKEMSHDIAGTTREGRQRASKNNVTLEFESVDDLTKGRNIELKEEDDVQKPLRSLLPAVPLHLIEKEGEKSHSKIGLYQKNFELIGNKEDFRVNRCYISSSGVLSLSQPLDISQQSSITNKSYCGFNAQSFSPLRQRSRSPPKRNVPPDIEEDNIDGTVDDIDIGGEMGDVEEENFLSDTKDLPPSTKDEGEEKADKVDIEKGRELRSQAPKDNTVKLNLKDPLKPMDPHLETPANRPVRKGRIRKPAPCHCHKVTTKSTRLHHRALKEKVLGVAALLDKETASSKTNKETLPIEDFLGFEIDDFILNNNDLKLKGKLPFPVDSRLSDKLVKEEIKKMEILKEKKIEEMQMATSQRKRGAIDRQEAVELLQENSRLKQVEDQLNDGGSDFGNDDAPDLDLENINVSQAADINYPEPHKDIVTAYGVIPGDDDKNMVNRSMNDTLYYETSSEYEALVQRWVADFINNAQEQINSTELTRRVNRWRKHISPILSAEEDRKVFNIHDYGSHILSQFSDSGENANVVSFGNLVHGQESREVARTFLSCLMLANTQNIELSLSNREPLQMDCLEMQLLSKERHHERIEEDFTGSPSKKKNRAKRKSVSPCLSTGGVSSSEIDYGKPPITPKSKRATNKLPKRTRLR